MDETSVYDMLPGQSVISQKALQEEQYEAESSKLQKLKASMKDRREQIVITVLYGISFLFTAFVTLENIIDFFRISTEFRAWHNPVFVALGCIIPFLIWVRSTDNATFNYHTLKIRMFKLCSLNWILLTIGYFRIAIMKIMRMLFFSIPVSGTLPIPAVIVGYYVSSGAIIGFAALMFCMRVNTSIDEKVMKRAIMRFRMAQIKPVMPGSRKFNYDMCVIRNLKTGRKFRIYEDDRRLHFKGVGSTGGGKTATLLTTSFEADIRQKVHNIDFQKKEMEKLIREGKAYLTKEIDDIDFNIDFVKPLPTLDESTYKEVADKIKKIKYKAKNAGITVMCPNKAFCDELYETAKAKGLRVNRIDPMADPDEGNRDLIGFSPLYVPIIEGEEDQDYFFRVFTAAKLYADVNQAIFEMGGQGDPYFNGLNKNVSVTAAVAVIIAYPLLHPGEYATIEQVQQTVNDFQQIKPYRDAIVYKYGKRNEVGAPIMEGKVDVGPNLQFVIDRIDRDFLGSNSEKISEQATGLRNIIDESLMNPRIRNVLCSKRTINIDKALENGELTLVNYEISLGSDATGFGMFFLLSFIQSIFRRPGTLKTRLPHFFALDEMPYLLVPQLERAIVLSRQYNVSHMLLMQSLAQYEKNDITRYMKSVLTGNCAHQIIFGRASREDMEFYEKLSGYKWETEESESMRESSITDEKTSQTYTHNIEVEQSERISIDDVRYREFLECTVFSVRNSTPLEPFLGKTDFLPRNYDPHMKRYRVDWHQLYNDKYTEKVKDDKEIVSYTSGGSKTSFKNTKTIEVNGVKYELDLSVPFINAVTPDDKETKKQAPASSASQPQEEPKASSASQPQEEQPKTAPEETNEDKGGATF